MPLPRSPVGCPMDSLLRLLMGPWTTYILWVLRSNGPTRFGELKRRVAGVSAKMLTERLRMLEEAGVVFRDCQPTVPPQVTYGLTARGEELRQGLDALSQIAASWQAADQAASGVAAQVATQSPPRAMPPAARRPGDGAEAGHPPVSAAE